MNIFFIDFISILMISGFMFISCKGRRIFQKAHVLLTVKMRKRGRP